MKYAIAIVFLIMQTAPFKQQQILHARVKTAYANKLETVKAMFTAAKVSNDGFTMFVRVFKKEQQLEVWVKEKHSNDFFLLHTYAICAPSGTLGPKRKEGDLQVPEGVYYIKHFNPVSSFHLSLGINYPNAADLRHSDKQHPGSNIYIHGNCVTIGCVPISDDKIEELYVMAVEARNNGQEKIPVYIFPARLDKNALSSLVRDHNPNDDTLELWKSLQLIYDDFQSTHQLKKVKVTSAGYQL